MAVSDAEFQALEKRVDELEKLLTKVRAEVTATKRFLWGATKNPPTVKTDVC